MATTEISALTTHPSGCAAHAAKTGRHAQESMRLSRKERTTRDLLHINRVETINTETASLTIGWQVRFQRRGDYHSKFFSDAIYGTSDKALAAAREYRNHFLEEHNEELGQLLAERTFILPHLPKNNTSGILGVNRSIQRERSGNTYYVWQSTYRDMEGKVRNASFRTRRHGEIGALMEAIRFRRNGIEAIAKLPENEHAVSVITAQIQSYDALVSYLVALHGDEAESVSSYLARTDVPPSTKKRFIEVRVTQAQFRHEVRAFFDNRCAVTGSGSLLVASHIKPWAICSDKDRIDKYNGILLSAAYDAAFDVGLITFDEAGRIRIAATFRLDAELLGIKDDAAVTDYTVMHDRYMQYHRDHIFRSLDTNSATKREEGIRERK